MNKIKWTSAAIGLLAFACSPADNEKNESEAIDEPQKKSENDLPNFVFIYADDLGYGDLGCFGATDIKTPNIDRMANEGIKFTEFYSASPVSSPSRAALLTGRVPQRMGINGVFFPESYTGMPTSEITIADILKKEGYKTGIVGKWHLGHRHQYLPLQRGFDEYFGIPYSNDMESVVYMKNNKVVEFHVDQHYTTQTYTEKALKFIDKHQNQPFFLYVAHNMPHVPIYASQKFEGTSERGLYGDVVQELDWSVGQILNKLQQTGVLENTLIVFSSDNGPWLVMREMGGSAGELREGKQTTFEGGVRVPTVAMWKGHIKPGTVYDDIACMVDWLPTFAHLAGATVPKDREIDGQNITPVLMNEGKRPVREMLYFSGDDLRGYRNGDWKIKKEYAGCSGTPWRKKVAPHPTLLINLKEDPGEKNNLAEEKPEKTKEMLQLMEKSLQEMGELPPSLVIRTGADNSHYKYLQKKYGNKKK